MRNYHIARWLVIAAALVAVGCLISGTFVVVESFSFTTNNGFYYYSIDVTNQSDWQKNRDYIDQIEAVGFEFYITNSSTQPATFKAYVDDYSGAPTATQVPAGATQILSDLTVPAGKTKITYAQSLDHITNLPRIRDLARTGKFDFYGLSDAANGTNFQIDSGKVIITVSASRK